MLFWIWVFVCLICWEVGWQPNEGLLHHNTNGSCFCGSGCIIASTLKGSPPKKQKKLEIFQTFFYPLLGYCAVIANSTAQVCALCNNFSGLWNPGPECLRQIPTKNCLGPYWAQLQISERFVLGVHLDTKPKVHKKNMYFKQIPTKNFASQYIHNRYRL